MSPLPRQGWLFLIEFLKMVFLEILGKCELGRFSLRQSHIDAITDVHGKIHLDIIVVGHNLLSKQINVIFILYIILIHRNVISLIRMPQILSTYDLNLESWILNSVYIALEYMSLLYTTYICYTIFHE